MRNDRIDITDMPVARLAVAVAVFTIDRPYDYKIPEKLMGRVLPGMRVTVPFGAGNKKTEGIVLSLTEVGARDKLKIISTVLDAEPVLTEENIKLALWMSDRFFCTVYDAFRAMLPAGMWFRDGVRRTGDKTVSAASLAIPSEEAVILAARKRLARAPAQAAILELMASSGDMSVKEIGYFTGSTSAPVKSLVKEGILTLYEREVFRRPKIRTQQDAPPVTLSPAQTVVYEELKGIASGGASAALLCGVTGSGKTLVYIKLIEDIIARGKTAIALVPEISLTPQLMSIFTSYFGDNVAVLHSALGVGERYDEWKRIRSGQVSVVVGTRSAVFAPVNNLGLIVLDEEQEHTYKSENSPRYHARDIAKYRCAKSGAMLLLGSATPSVESMYSAKCGKYTLLRLPGRYNERDMPDVIIADMKKELKSGNGGQISSVLQREIEVNLKSGEQSILFINRRGANTLVACPECGYTYSCPHCSVSMTYHSVNSRLMCHYCGYSQPLSGDCPDCGGKLKYIGAGTQKVEDELNALFPGISIIRMDADTVSYMSAHETLLSRFRDEGSNILLGTQMVTKGLDFENVTLVGVLSADASLYINDYRANERTFSMITQVVGRSGRGDRPGRAVIQTFTPEHEVIKLASRQDYDGFFDREIEMRRALGTPPISDLLTLSASGTDETAVLRSCVKLRTALERYFSGVDGIRILGPAPMPVSKINNRYRYRILISGENSKGTREIIAHTMRQFSKDKQGRGVSVFADVDPYE